MRAEDRDPWEQWWQGVGERELTKHLASHGLDHRFAVPIIEALRNGATVPDLERLLPRLCEDLGVAADEDRDGRLAVAASLWWDGSRYSRARFGVQ